MKHAKEQTQQNDDKLKWCSLEIAKHTERYRTKKLFKIQSTTTAKTIQPEVKSVFDILQDAYEHDNPNRQRFVYKTFIRNTINKGLLSDKYKTVESVLKILPKTKFD